MISQFNRGKAIQAFVAIIASITELLCGILGGWSSPIGTIVVSEDTPLQSGSMSQQEISLMTSLLYVGAIVGCFLGGWLVNCIGRKWTLLLTMTPQVISTILIILAKSPLLLFLARTLSGILVGATLVVLPIYITEIAEKNIKTTLGNTLIICCNVGVFLGKSLTDLWGFYAVPVTCLIFTLIFIAFFMVLPDTPEYLIFRDKLEEAEKSLKFYRGLKKDDPLPEQNLLEFEEMKNQVQQRDQTTSLSLKDFKGGSNILAIIISLILILNSNFVGIRIAVSFTENILQDSGVPMDISLADMIISLLQIFGSLVTIYLVQWMGIRLSLLVFFLVSFAAFFGSGVHYFLHDNGQDMLPLKWSFLILITIAIIVPGTIINNLTMSIPSQILPVKIKGSVMGTLNILSLVIACFMTQYYLYFVENLGNVFVMSAFGVWCLFSVIFTYFFIPELNGKSFSEIISSLERKIPERFKNQNETIVVMKN